MGDCCAGHHPNHDGELPRLNRVAGQVEGIKNMITAQRYCPDIITQLRAVRAALKTIEASMLERHLSQCVKDAMQHGNAAEQAQKIAELVAMFKRFED